MFTSYVNAPERLQRCVDDAQIVFGLGDVCDRHRDLCAGLIAYAAGGRFERLAPARPEHELRPLARERARRCVTDTAAAAADDGCLAGQTHVHRASFAVLRQLALAVSVSSARLYSVIVLAS